MKNDDAQDDKSNHEHGVTSSSVRVKTHQKNKKSNSQTDQPSRHKKKSFCEVWRSYSRFKQAEFVIAALIATGGIGYLIFYIVVSMKQIGQTQAQHMPLVINSRPPEFLEPFVCNIKDGFRTGNMQTAVKNIGTTTAYHVIPWVFDNKIIPEKKTGDASTDALPRVNCKLRPSAKEMERPLAPGLELVTGIRQSAINLPPIRSTDPIQLFMRVCVYYSDEYGGNHGTCDTYQAQFPSSNPLDVLSGSPTFFCDSIPRIAKFTGTNQGHCQE